MALSHAQHPPATHKSDNTEQKFDTAQTLSQTVVSAGSDKTIRETKGQENTKMLVKFQISSDDLMLNRSVNVLSVCACVCACVLVTCMYMVRCEGWYPTFFICTYLCMMQFIRPFVAQ